MIDGNIGRKLGFDWFMDQLIPTQATGAVGAGALTANGVNAIGATSLSMAKGAGVNWAALAGDIFTIAGSTQPYVVTANTTVTQNANTSVPISPALVVATAGGEAITVTAAHTMNLAFHRDAFALAIRPLSAIGGESLGSMFSSATDPVTGIPLRLEVRREHKRTRFSFDVLWGSALVRPDLACRLMG